MEVSSSGQIINVTFRGRGCDVTHAESFFHIGIPVVVFDFLLA